MGRDDEAIVEARRGLQIDPLGSNANLGSVFVFTHQWDKAIAALKQAISLEGTTEVWASLGHAYAVSGKREEAQNVIKHIRELSVHQYVAPYNIALFMRVWEKRTRHLCG